MNYGNFDTNPKFTKVKEMSVAEWMCLLCGSMPSVPEKLNDFIFHVI